jgi:hypothetical protein
MPIRIHCRIVAVPATGSALPLQDAGSPRQK